MRCNLGKLCQGESRATEVSPREPAAPSDHSQTRSTSSHGLRTEICLAAARTCQRGRSIARPCAWWTYTCHCDRYFTTGRTLDTLSVLSEFRDQSALCPGSMLAKLANRLRGAGGTAAADPSARIYSPKCTAACALDAQTRAVEKIPRKRYNCFRY